jgi:hypothetical protein
MTETPTPMPDTTAPPADLEAYKASVREEIARHGGDPATAVGFVVGAASSCWSNLGGAGVFESERASALVDVLLEYVTPCACQTTEQRTHRRGDEAFCALGATR